MKSNHEPKTGKDAFHRVPLLLWVRSRDAGERVLAGLGCSFTALRLSRLSGLFTVALLASSLLAGAEDNPIRPNLAGTVSTKNGEPITNASVFIYTAGPRLGPGYLCPSCYADCRKSARSGDAGKFTIESLDPGLLFRVLVVAPGHAPTFFDKVDPAKGLLMAKLKARSITNLPANQLLLGRVVDAAKKPVAFAAVSPYAVANGSGTTYGGVGGVEPLAVTDERGEFGLALQKPHDAISVQVEARGFARGRFQELRPGAKRQELAVTEGASLTGRLSYNGKLLKDITVGAVSSDRSPDKFVGNSEVATGADGKFLFVNLPPNRDYDIYALMSSLKGLGALPGRKIHVNGDGTLANAGELSLVPGKRLAGEVKLSDGKPIPAHTRLAMEPGGSWDVYAMELPPDGKFNVPSVPAGELTVWVTLNGYHHSPQNFSLDHYNPHLVGRLDADKTNLTILLEPGDRLQPNYSEPIPEEERPDHLPLSGVERSRADGHLWVITGRVVNALTKAPLPAFRIVPGHKQGWDTPFTEWYPSRGSDQSNGTFRVEFSRKAGLVVLKAEAAGYLPEISDTMALGHTNVEIQLKRGIGPKGVVLLPDGKSAAGVTVLYLGPMEQANLDDQGKLRLSNLGERDTSQTLTDPEGRFEFPPKFEGGEILAANDFGFARLSAKGLAAKRKLTLRPWARVDGRLVQKGKAVVNENVDLERSGRFIMEAPVLGLPGARTDDEGRFVIERAPPGQLQIATRVPMGPGWIAQPQMKFDAPAGTSVSLGKINKTDR